MDCYDWHKHDRPYCRRIIQGSMSEGKKKSDPMVALLTGSIGESAI